MTDPTDMVCQTIVDYLHSSCSPLRPYAYAWGVERELGGVRITARTWKGNGLAKPFIAGTLIGRLPPATPVGFGEVSLVAGDLLRKLDRLHFTP